MSLASSMPESWSSSPYDRVVTAAPLDLNAAPTSLAERAYVAIRDQLIMLDIRPNEPIDDDALASSLGVGRTPVREALKRLEGDRLVVSYPRRGTFATGMDITDLAHISEIRVQLEPLAARRAAERAPRRSEEHTSELQPRQYLVCRLLLEKNKSTSCSCASSTRSRSRLGPNTTPPTRC